MALTGTLLLLLLEAGIDELAVADAAVVVAGPAVDVSERPQPAPIKSKMGLNRSHVSARAFSKSARTPTCHNQLGGGLISSQAMSLHDADAAVHV